MADEKPSSKTGKVKNWFRSRSRSSSSGKNADGAPRSTPGGTTALGPAIADKSSPTSSRPVSMDSDISSTRGNFDSISKTGKSPVALHGLESADSEECAARKQEPWSQALSYLDNEERALLGSISTDASNKLILLDLQKVALDKQRECQERAWKISFGGRRILVKDIASKVIAWINTFKGIGDTIVQVDPIYAGLPWAAIKLILSVATADQEQMGLILIGVENVTWLITRCTAYQQIYLDDEDPKTELGNRNMSELRDALTRLYAKILSFLAYYISLLDMSAAIRTLRAYAQPQKVSEMLAEIDRYEKRMSTAADLCEKHSSQQALQQVDQKSQKLHDQLRNVMSQLDAEMVRFWKKLDEDERSKIFQWISDIPYESDHYAARKGRVDGTGEWLLRHHVYLTWRESRSSRVLWLNGIPGAGKTKLSSKVVDDLLTTFGPNKNRKSAIAYFYCDRNRADHREPVAIMRSILRQLCAPQDDSAVDASVEDKYLERKRRGFANGRLVSEECNELLLQSITGNIEAYIILDGLDECERETRHILMDLLDDMIERSPQPLKVYIASRTDQDLRKRYHKTHNLEVTASDNSADIEKYLLNKLEQSEFCRTKLAPKVRNKVLSTFNDKSQGMFQWATLHIGELLQLGRNADILKYLDDLPKGLEAAYDKIYTQISNQIGSKKDVAFAAFKVIMVSSRPLHPFELAIAVTQDPENDFILDEDVDISYVLEACHNLVIVTNGAQEGEVMADKTSQPTSGVIFPNDYLFHEVKGNQSLKSKSAWTNALGVTETSICKFSHLSVQEYLESRYWTTVDANAFVACICLRTLLCLRIPDDPYQPVELSNSDGTEEELDGLVQFQVAECERRTHLKVVPIISESQQCESDGLGDNIGQTAHSKGHRDSGLETREGIAPISLGEKHICEMPETTKSGLEFECFIELINPHGHDDAESCLSQEFEPYFQGRQGSAVEGWALYCAHSLWHHIAAIQLDTGSSSPHSLTLRALVKQFMGAPSDSSAHYRAWARLAQNMDISHFHNYDEGKPISLRALIRPTVEPVIGAVMGGFTDILRTWGKEGTFDPNLCVSNGESLVYLATAFGQLEVCEVLLDLGADPNITNNSQFTALDVATDSKRVDILQALLKHGADPNLSAAIISKRQGQKNSMAISKYDAPLVKAVEAGDFEIVRTLLKAGADPSLYLLPGGFNYSALGIAAFNSRKDLVVLLLDHLSNVSSRLVRDMVDSALEETRRATDAGIEVMKVLVPHTNITNSSIIHHAVREKNLKFAEAFLEYGGNIEARDLRMYRDTPLLALFRERNADTLEKTRWLLDKGANVNSCDRDGMTPLLLCMLNPLYYSVSGDNMGTGNEKGESRFNTIRELLERGANPNIRNRDGANAVSVACDHAFSPPEVFQLLLDHGADVNAIIESGGKQTSPLDIVELSIFLNDLDEAVHAEGNEIWRPGAVSKADGRVSDPPQLSNTCHELDTHNLGGDGVTKDKAHNAKIIRHLLKKAGAKHVRMRNFHSWDMATKLSWLDEDIPEGTRELYRSRHFTGWE
ncbi:Vegetative incompatibility protein [Paramyrothecium foliicola]|nr:Vegetative incompatibility protein [Paramyrothecium foliicola]